MDNIQKTKELQQQNGKDVQTTQKHIQRLIGRVNSSGLSQSSKIRYIQLLNDQSEKLNTLSMQMSHHSTNRYQALKDAQTQKAELAKIVDNLIKIKTSLDNHPSAESQKKPLPTRDQINLARPPSAAQTSDNYVFPEVPTTPLPLPARESTSQSNPILDQFVAVERQLYGSRSQLISLNQLMLAEKNTEKKIMLSAVISSAQQTHATIQRHLQTVYSQSPDPKKANALQRLLTDIARELTNLDNRMGAVYGRCMPVTPSSSVKNAAQPSLEQRLKAARDQYQNPSTDEPRRGPGQR